MLVQRAVESITAEDHPLKKKMALNSATRLLVITAVALAIAFFFRHTAVWAWCSDWRCSRRCW